MLFPFNLKRKICVFGNISRNINEELVIRLPFGCGRTREKDGQRKSKCSLGLNYHNYRNDLEELSYPEEEVNSICQILSKKTVQGKDPKRKRRKEKRDFEKSTI